VNDIVHKEIDKTTWGMSVISNLASITVFAMSSLLLYWSQVMKSISFYSKLFTQSMTDARSFIVLLFTMYFSFALASLLFDESLVKTAEILIKDPNYKEDLKDLPYYTHLYRERFGKSSNFVNAVFSYYLLGLGEYDLWGSEEPIIHPLFYIYFFLATLLLQMIFVPVLVAIFGGSLEVVNANRDIINLQNRTDLYFNHLWWFEASWISHSVFGHSFPSNYLNKFKFLYVIKPTDEASSLESVAQALQTKISKNKVQTKRSLAKLHDKFDTKLQNVETTNREILSAIQKLHHKHH